MQQPQKMTRRDLALRQLQRAGDRGVTTAEFLGAGVGSRYSARVLELRELGYVISSERVRDGQWRYCLSSEPSSPSATARATTPVVVQPKLFDVPALAQ